MPTPESSSAFARLVAARERLTEVTKLLNEAKTTSESQDGLAEGLRVRLAEHKRLQGLWEQAYAAFVAATDEFQSVVHNIRGPEEKSER